MLLPIVMAFTLNCLPLKLNWAPETNLTTDSEKIFARDWRFLIPLYVYTIFDFLTWLWALFIFADEGAISRRMMEYCFAPESMVHTNNINGLS